MRAAEPSDAAAINAVAMTPRAIRGTLQVPYTSDALRAQSLPAPSPHVCSLVADGPDGDVVGSLGMRRAQGPRRIHTATLGMSVRDDWQGRGVGTALLAAALHVADEWWQVRRVHLEVFTDNDAAIALYRRFGFEVEGTLRQDAFRSGEYCDTYVMGRLRASS